MPETTVNLIIGALIAIISGGITSIIDYYLRSKEEARRRIFELENESRKRSYELSLLETERAEQYLKNMEDGFYELSNFQNKLCLGIEPNSQSLGVITTPYETASKNFGFLLVFDDDAINEMASELLSYYIQEFTKTLEIIELPKDQRPNQKENLGRLMSCGVFTRDRIARIRKKLNGIKLAAK